MSWCRPALCSCFVFRHVFSARSVPARSTILDATHLYWLKKISHHQSTIFSFLYPPNFFVSPKESFLYLKKVFVSQNKHHFRGTLYPQKKHCVHPKKWHPWEVLAEHVSDTSSMKEGLVLGFFVLQTDFSFEFGVVDDAVQC